MIYSCESCYFITNNKKDYNRHLSSKKHAAAPNKTTVADDNEVIITQTTLPTIPPLYPCEYCNRSFKSRTTIYPHKAKCKLRMQEKKQQQQEQQEQQEQQDNDKTTPQENTIVGYIVESSENVIPQPYDDVVCVDDKITITKELFITLLKDNQQMMKMLKSMSQQQQTSQFNNNTIHTTNSNNMTNCHNPTFNMNMFLNEKCKDAMNMKDFVNSIQLSMTDMENVGRLGYVQGMSNILIDNLQKTDIYKRPVHCSDVKRETLYVKENNQWQREGPERTKMTNAVLAVEHKNVVLVNEWANANPRCLNSNTQENEKYIRLSKIVTDGEKEGNIDKVIRKVAKRVAIEKANAGAIGDS